MMQEPQIIQCSTECTITVVHEFNNPLLNLSLDDAAALMPAITLVFCLAWGIRAMLRLLNSREKENDDV